MSACFNSRRSFPLRTCGWHSSRCTFPGTSITSNLWAVPKTACMCTCVMQAILKTDIWNVNIVLTVAAQIINSASQTCTVFTRLCNLLYNWLRPTAVIVNFPDNYFCNYLIRSNKGSSQLSSRHLRYSRAFTTRGTFVITQIYRFSTSKFTVASDA